MSEPTALVPISVDLKGSTWTLYRVDSEPLIRDIDWAERLGYERPRAIRDLIKRMIKAGRLGEVVCRTVRQTPGSAGGRSADEYYLTKGQALKVAARAETELADAILDEVIQVFLLAASGNGAAAAALATGAPHGTASLAGRSARELLAIALAQQDQLEAVERQQAQLADQQVELAAKTDQLDAKVTKLLDKPAPRPRPAPGEQCVSAAKVASELGITPRTFSLFLRARNKMRTLQRSDGRWPLAATVQRYHDLLKDTAAQLAMPEPVVHSPERQALAKYVRMYCAGLNRGSEQFADTYNLCYERFVVEVGYDPRALSSTKMSALDVVQVNGHIPQFFEIIRRFCPMSEMIGSHVGHA